jgi:hypothetical protein
MLPQDKGSIVNISSSFGKVGGPTVAVYVGSKHAVEGITKSAATELAGTGVRVNIVSPGPVETGMFNRFAQTKENKANFLDAQVPNKRIGTPEEIANAIVFIGSDKASYIVGASLAVDGGMIADRGLPLAPESSALLEIARPAGSWPRRRPRSGNLTFWFVMLLGKLPSDLPTPRKLTATYLHKIPLENR